MPRERDSYILHLIYCPLCDYKHRCRTLPIYRPTTLMVACPKCRGDIVIACMPDEFMDGQRQANGQWEVPLVDLIYLEDGLTEHEGDRLLWGHKNTLEQQIAEYVNGASKRDIPPVSSAE